MKTNQDTAEPILAVENVSKSYSGTDEASLVLRSVNLTVAKSEFISIIGPSGCGKTTLMKICAGLLSQTSGVVTFAGKAGTPPPRKMGVVFQSAALLPWRTVMANILLPATIQKANMTKAKERARELLDMLNLVGVESKYPWELSGGMQQRVSIARSLVLEPEVLFMDEPFGALDAMTREKLNLDLQAIHARTGATIMFVTHNIAEAVFLSDRIVAMAARPGRVADVIDVTLDRPRTQDSYVDEDFREIETRVRNSFDRAAAS
ncbi:ABC transporter ATP-binding protein [Lacisediminihabitans profunda]|uniref:ABC transporter ATP-binding protein n=1 Tax=Lacisediminihabitans profunda TaxID=2594790 RepID=A0A5C8UTJ6_9MICO|nr:ABC transporter ATP-binding protein [Lacisediminihabitans profunda]TXN30938.1 ABC transporter ATP-binding protein [Lacisediminihabitans profunda]